MKRVLLILLMISIASCNEESKNIKGYTAENDLCRFDEGVVIGISSNGNIKYMSCLINGKAEKIQVTHTLFTYVFEVYSPGDTVRCSVSNKPKRTNKVPTLE